MTTKDLIKGKRYRRGDKFVGEYEGTFETEAYLDKGYGLRSVMLYQFKAPHGWTWLLDYEVNGWLALA